MMLLLFVLQKGNNISCFVHEQREIFLQGKEKSDEIETALMYVEK